MSNVTVKKKTKGKERKRKERIPLELEDLLEGCGLRPFFFLFLFFFFFLPLADDEAPAAADAAPLAGAFFASCSNASEYVLALMSPSGVLFSFSSTSVPVDLPPASCCRR